MADVEGGVPGVGSLGILSRIWLCHSGDDLVNELPSAAAGG